MHKFFKKVVTPIIIGIFFFAVQFTHADQGYIKNGEIVIDGVIYKNTETEFQKMPSVFVDSIPPTYDESAYYGEQDPFPSMDGQTVSPAMICEDTSLYKCISITSEEAIAIGEPVFGASYNGVSLWQKVSYGGKTYYVPVGELNNEIENNNNIQDILIGDADYKNNTIIKSGENNIKTKSDIYFADLKNKNNIYPNYNSNTQIPVKTTNSNYGIFKNTKIKNEVKIAGSFVKGIVINTAKDIYNIASHPIKNVKSIGLSLYTGAKGIGKEWKQAFSNPINRIKGVKNSFRFITDYWKNDPDGFKNELLNETKGGAMFQNKIDSCSKNTLSKAECAGEISGMIIAGGAIKNVVKMNNIIKISSATKKMAAVKIGAGATLGIGGQVIEDVGKWELGSKEEYIGSAIGGGVEGLFFNKNSKIINVIGSITGNVTREAYIGNSANSNPDYFRAATIGVISEIIPSLSIRTKNTAISKQIQTKIQKGIINNFSTSTAVKVGIGEITENLQKQLFESASDIGYSYFKKTSNQSWSIGDKSDLKLEDIKIDQNKLNAILSNIK